MSEKMTPNVRFKGFSNDWEQRKLEDMSTITDTKHATAPTSESITNYRMIRTSNVRMGKLLITGMDYVTKSVYEEWSERIHLKSEDVVFSREAPIGEAAVIPKDNNCYFLGQRMVAIRPNAFLNSYFLLASFLIPKFKKEVFVRNSESTTVANFGIPSIKKYKISIPKLIEQRKIGKILNSLDTTIASNQKKVNQLKMLKKLFLQKIFDQEWRFRGFTDPWEQRKLGDVSTRVKSYSLSRDVESNYFTSQKYIHYGDIHTRRAARVTNLNLLPNIQVGNYVSLRYGDIAVADASEDYKDIAVPAILLDSSKKAEVIAGLHTIAFRPMESVNSEFIYHDLFTRDFKHYVYRVGQGLKVFGISSTHFFEYQICYPQVEEQVKIVKTLNTLDATIASNQKQLDHLKKLKKWLLQNMFA
ncbi:restriction endonuclease subunit S [Levilactobacillus zymae]|uniref:restriction endonuclease subunit S n=1 Tax=Levilactobacillus zymae TaxID=267363 RepID=UPI003FCE973A